MSMTTIALWCVAGDRVVDRSGHRWTVLGHEPVDDDDPDGDTVVHVRDAAGREQFFPPQAVFTRER